MALIKRTSFYLGLIMLTVAIIFLGAILYLGPHPKFEREQEILYDHPHSRVFDDIKPGDKLELNFESDKPVNVIIMRAKNSGDYFILEDYSVEHYVLASESTAGSFDYKFTSSGDWGVYFENPTPPPRAEPVVRYWGRLIRKDDGTTMYYLNIAVGIIFIILGLVFLYSSRAKKQKPGLSKTQMRKILKK